MRIEEIDENLRNVSFEYFYWFSRFEFALKENSYLVNVTPKSKAEASWETFREKYKSSYSPSEEANELIKLHPKRQLIGNNKELIWQPVGISHCSTELCKVIAMLTTIRNNLFHGGKHGDIEVDDKERNIKLLSLGKTILGQLAEIADFVNDYERRY